jgi:hypothetical protein
MSPRTMLAAVVLLIATAAPLHAQVASDSDFINHLYGLTGTVTVRPSAPQVGTTALLTAKFAPARFALLVCNESVNQCECSPNALVTATYGFVLSPGGGCLNTNVKDDLLLPAQEWWCLCGAASSQLYMQETYLQ